MAYEVIRVVTQPFHGADGSEVLYQPGDLVPVEGDLPDGLRTTLAVGEVADEPTPKAAEAKAAGKASAKG